MDSSEEDLTPILERMNAFHLEWLALNDKYKTVQSSLIEVSSKNEELEMKLSESVEQTAKFKEENKKLLIIIKKLQKKLESGFVPRFIDALKQSIRAYDETFLPSIFNLTKNITSTEDDFNISVSEDEDEFFNRVIGASKNVETSANRAKVSQSLSVPNVTSIDDNLIINSSYQDENESYSPVDAPLRSVGTPISNIDASSSNHSASSGNTATQRYRVITKKKNPLVLTLLKKNSLHSNTVVNLTGVCSLNDVISSTTPEKGLETSVISNIPKCADPSNSSSSSQNNVSTTNETDTEPTSASLVNIILKPSDNCVQPNFIDPSDIEALCIAEECVSDDHTSSLAMDSPYKTTSDLDVESSLSRKKENQQTSNFNEDCEESNIFELQPQIIPCNSSERKDFSCNIVKSDTIRKSETSRPERVKRPLPSSSSTYQSSSKRLAIEKSFSSARPLKCLICEYEKIDNNENFESCLALDDHIIKWHPKPDPPYIRCTFKNGKCTKHFTTKQKFYKHVKCAHPDDLHNFEESETNQESDIKEHGTVVRGKFFNNRKKSKEQPSSAECEICKRENRLLAKYKLYDELDAHISKCHPDPSPDYLRCPYCKRHFKNVKWLSSHIINKHDNKYSTSPLERFNLFETSLSVEEDRPKTTNPVPIAGSKLDSNLCSLRILSPAAINKALATAAITLAPSRK